MKIDYKNHGLGAIAFGGAAALFQQFGSKTYPIFQGVTKFSVGGAALLGVGIYALRRLVNDVLLKNSTESKTYSWKIDLAITLLVGCSVGLAAIGFSLSAGVTGASIALVGFLVDQIAKKIFFGKSEIITKNEKADKVIDLTTARKFIVIQGLYLANHKDILKITKNEESDKLLIEIYNILGVKVKSILEGAEKSFTKLNKQIMLKKFFDKLSLNVNSLVKYENNNTLDDDFADDFYALWLLGTTVNVQYYENSEKLMGIVYSDKYQGVYLDDCTDNALEFLDQAKSLINGCKVTIEKLLTDKKLIKTPKTEDQKLTEQQNIDNYLIKYLEEAKVKMEKSLENLNVAIETEKELLENKNIN